MAVNLEDVVRLAEQLDDEQQNLLIYRLRLKQGHERPRSQHTPLRIEPNAIYQNPSREQLLRDVEQLRQIPAKPSDRLLGKYANPDALDMTAEAFHAQMHAIATEWEQELDEFFDDKS